MLKNLNQKFVINNIVIIIIMITVYDLVVVSPGGVGCTYFMNKLIKRTKLKINDILDAKNNPIDRIKHISSPTKIEARFKIKKAIFIFNDPLLVIKSHFKRGWTKLQIPKLGNPFSIDPEISYSNYLKLVEENQHDIFGIEYQFDNWVQNIRDYPVMFIHFPTMMQYKKDIIKYMNVNPTFFNDFIVRKKRDSKIDNESSIVVDIYNKLYKKMLTRGECYILKPNKPIIYAIIPIKHESTRVPGKNYRLMNDKPLYFYVINTLLKSKYIDKIFIDTNSIIVKDGLKKLLPLNKIIIYDRPKVLWPGNTSTNKLLVNIISDLKLDAELYLQTHITNPLLKHTTIDLAIENYFRNKMNYDCLFSVKKLHTRLYNKNGSELNHNKFNLIPTQDLDPIYEENSCIYIFPKDTLFKYNSRIGSNPLLYPIDDIESQDIDWEYDFVVTEQLMKLMNNPQKIANKFTKKLCILEQSASGPTNHHIELFMNNSQCDFYYMTFKKEKINDPNYLGFFPDSVWIDTRNELAKRVPKNYEYYFFIDDDIELTSLTDIDVIDQILLDLNNYNPAILVTNYLNENKDYTTNYVSRLFSNNCVKIIHHSLLEWFFPIPNIFEGTYDSAHLFNILEIPFKDNIIQTNNITSFNSKTHNYTKSAAIAMKKIWNWFRPALKIINNDQNPLVIKKYYMDNYYIENPIIGNKINNYLNSVNLEIYFDCEHVFFKKYRYYLN